MKRTFRLILVSVIILSSASCRGNDVYLNLSLQEGYSKTFNNMLEKYPLPDGIFISRDSREDAVGTVTLKSGFPNIENPNGLPTDSENNPDNSFNAVISREWYSLTSKIWEPSTDAELTDFKEKTPVLLKDITLPDRAVSINGLYPDDKRYPGLKTTVLTLNLHEKNRRTVEIINWFNNIKLRYEKSLESYPVIIWIGAVGDIMVQRGVQEILTGSDSGLNTVFSDTLDILQRQDIMLGNLEGTVTETRIKTPKSYNFKFNKEVLPVLQKAGFDYLSLTNNHVYDYGKQGFIDTLKNLEEARIATSGAGMDIAEARRYWETESGKSKVRVLSIGAYPREKNGFDGRTQASAGTERPGILFEGPDADKAVRNMVSRNTFDILFIHGGVEWTYSPSKEQRKLYRKYIDMGADLVIGSHPHVLQGMEAYKGKIIAYSLGNFIFPGMDSMNHAEESLILTLGIIDNKIKYVIPYPVKINNRTIKLDHRDNVYKRFLSLTEKVNLRQQEQNQ